MTSQSETRPIYLDNHATTPVDPRVAAAVLSTMTSTFGNPNSSEHLYGEEASNLVDVARRQIGELLSTNHEAIHFTSGATESIRIALAHAVSQRGHGPLRVALARVEHRAVLDVVLEYERRGEATVDWIPVDGLAQIDLDALDSVCHKGIDLVCVMAANNEVGTVYPLKDVAAIATSVGARTLVDATQAAGSIPLNLNEFHIDYVAFSAHKMYGPKGVGALVARALPSVRTTNSPTPGTDDGTPNVPGIVGLGEACRLRRLEMGNDERRMAALRDELQGMLQVAIPDLMVNGDIRHRLANNLHVAVPGVPSDAVIARLRRYVALSSGAACSSGAQTHSHVLKAMGLPEAVMDGALRIGVGKFTTKEEINLAAPHIAAAVSATRVALALAR
jgi:cysteine desulfurase